MGRRPQDANLIPQAHVLTVEEQSKGGKASGAARRGKAKYKKIAQAMGEAQVPAGALRKAMIKSGVAEEDADWDAAIVAGLRNAAASGKTDATKMWFELTEEDVSEAEEATDKAVAIMRGNFWSGFGTVRGAKTSPSGRGRCCRCSSIRRAGCCSGERCTWQISS